MEILRSLRSLQVASIGGRSLQKAFSEGVLGVTIGNFDGMHLGHQALFSELQSALNSRPGGEKYRVLMTFYPHPRQFFAGVTRHAIQTNSGSGANFSSITTLREKAELAAEFGFTHFLPLQFNSTLASYSPEEFVMRFIVEGLKAKVVVIGYDWSFGAKRSGNPESLAALGRQNGFEVKVLGPVTVANERVSSSRVRELLASGDLEGSKRLLGRSYSVTGRVTHGAGRGGRLGIPTANLYLPGKCLPRDGVYATYAYANGVRYLAATNVGIRPTFGGERRIVEPHLLDSPNTDLYNSRVRLEFVSRIRDEIKFSSADELKAAIKNDIRRVREILS